LSNWIDLGFGPCGDEFTLVPTTAPGRPIFATGYWHDPRFSRADVVREFPPHFGDPAALSPVAHGTSLPPVDIEAASALEDEAPPIALASMRRRRERDDHLKHRQKIRDALMGLWSLYKQMNPRPATPHQCAKRFLASRDPKVKALVQKIGTERTLRAMLEGNNQMVNKMVAAEPTFIPWWRGIGNQDGKLD
jgi:hypothetical protein